MRAVIQRVTSASVAVQGKTCGSIAQGLVVLLGIEDADTDDDVLWLSQKICDLRIFDDQQKVMNRSLIDVQGNILLISQFTLHALIKKGNRPSYIRASKQEHSKPLYEKMIAQLSKNAGREIATGIFGADMQVSLTNNGPVTIWIDTQNKE